MGAHSPEDIPMIFEGEGVGWVRQATERGVVIELSHFEPGVQIDELFHGLPDDRCQYLHSGYVLEGEFVYRTAEGRSPSARARRTTSRRGTFPARATTPAR